MGIFDRIYKKTANEPQKVAEKVEVQTTLTQPQTTPALKSPENMRDLAFRSAHVRSEKAEARRNLSKTELEHERILAEIEKTKDLIELEKYKAELANFKEELKEVKGTDEEKGGNADEMLYGLLSTILNRQPQQQVYQAPPVQAVPVQAVPVQEEPQEEPFQSRFTDEQLKTILPQLLNKNQLQQLKSLNLNDDEMLQIGDIIKTL